MNAEPHARARRRHHPATRTAENAQDRAALTGVGEIVLCAVDAITNVARACPPEMREHVASLTHELAGATVDWVSRWPR